MALDGIILSKINGELNALLPLRIVKINSISDSELLFQLKSAHGRHQLFISNHSQFNHIKLTEHRYPIPQTPSNFVMLLRKYLENGLITAIEQEDLDRYLRFEITGHNELGEKDVHYMFVELMGKYANTILVDKTGRIMDALKRIPPFENQRRTIHPGAQFTYPDKQEKSDPFKVTSVDLDEPLTSQLQGFSPLLAKEVTYRLHNGEIFTEIMKEIAASKQLYLSNQNGQLFYHVIPLKHLNVPYEAYSINEGLDRLYFFQEEKDRIKQQTGDLFKIVRRELKKNEQKIVKLQNSLEEALDCDKWREYGDYLYTYQNTIPKGVKEVTLERFDGEGTITIPLDVRYDARYNGKKCFQKYNKGKSGQIHIQEQIDICQREIDYFTGLNQQLSLMDFNDINEIRQEMIEQGYLKDKGRNKRRKDPPLHYLTIHYDEETTIYVGKNNKQNEYVTFKKGRKEDTWFHALDYHGSHTVIHTDHLTEEKIRLCAMLAAYYSQTRDSSSIPVAYTQIRNLKKIPEAKGSQVTMSSYKTIYIDIDKELLKQYLPK